MKPPSRPGAGQARWVQVAISPIVGFGDDGARAVPHHDGLVRRWVAFLWALAATPFGSFTNETYFGRTVLIVLDALIVLLAISAIVVWIYASRT